MYLQGQESRGYAMAALLVSLSVLSVLMSMAMPVWRHQAQREKEAELVFRGEQYARAVYLYRRKNGGISPPSIDVLVQQRFIRKKYKDPMVADGEFQVIPMGGVPQAGTGGPTGRAGAIGPGGSPAGGRGTAPGVGGGFSLGGPGQFAAGGIQGVMSKSTQASIRIYRGGSHYNQWQFIAPVQQQPGGPGQQTPGIGGRGRGRGSPGGPGSGTGGGRGPGGRGRGVGPGGRGDFPGPGRGPGGSPFPIRPPGGRGVSH